MTEEAWSDKQMKAIELMASGRGLTLSEIQKRVDISQDTLWRWRKKPAFMDAVIRRAREMLREVMPQIYRSLGKEAAAGDIRHIKLVLEHLERLEGMSEQYKGGSITVVWKDSWDEEESTDPSIDN